jgi:ParB/RepB/Spo0J family partition protein
MAAPKRTTRRPVENIREFVSASKEGFTLDNVSDYEQNGEVTITITLTGKKVKAKLIEVPHADIERVTYISKYNERPDSDLTELSLYDILPEIKKDGMNGTPALAIIDEDGNLRVVYGSRRRKGCIFGEAKYQVLAISKEYELTEEEELSLSKRENITQEISIISKGEYYDNYIKRTGVTREVAANRLSESLTKISKSLKYYRTIPNEIISLYPFKAALGYGTCEKLVKLIKNGDRDQVIQLAEERRGDIDKLVSKALTSKDPSDYAEEFKKLTLKITAIIIDAAGVEKEKSKYEDIDSRGNDLLRMKKGADGSAIFQVKGRVLTKEVEDKIVSFLNSIVYPD